MTTQRIGRHDPLRDILDRMAEHDRETLSAIEHVAHTIVDYEARYGRPCGGCSNCRGSLPVRCASPKESDDKS